MKQFFGENAAWNFKMQATPIKSTYQSNVKESKSG